jgi:N-acetylglucosaminyl-diphospho-decaprenol L-rhamnosyltransferase
LNGPARPTSATAAPSLLIVIVNYRTPGLTIDCLASLEPEVAANPGARVVVADNESGDDSLDRLGAAILDRGWSGWAEARPVGSNRGFAAGNNAAIAPALASSCPPRYVWLLNPDTVARPGALTALVGFMEARPDVGLAGSRLEEPDGSRQLSAFRFPSILGELDLGARFWPLHRLVARWTDHPAVDDRPKMVDWASGASLFVRREVFEAIGLLDDGYFMYFEEVDFCLRARQAGWPCWYVPTSRVVHLVGQSSGAFNKEHRTKRLPGYWYESRSRYFVRNHGRAKAAVADLAWTLGALSFRARNLIQRKPDATPDKQFRDFVRHNFFPARMR